MRGARYPIGFWNYVSAEAQRAEPVKDWAEAEDAEQTILGFLGWEEPLEDDFAAEAKLTIGEQSAGPASREQGPQGRAWGT